MHNIGYILLNNNNYSGPSLRDWATHFPFNRSYARAWKRTFVFFLSGSFRLGMVELFGFVWWMIIFDLSLDLMPHGDIKSRVTKKTFRWVLIPSICLQPIMGKGLLRLPPFYAKCLLISASDLWTSLPRAFIDVGVPPNTPSVWYWSKPISWLLLRTVCCFADLFNPTRNDQRVLICLRHWGWSRPCSAHHQWVSGIRFALAQTHPFLSEGEPRISTVLRQTIESFSGPC